MLFDSAPIHPTEGTPEGTLSPRNKPVEFTWYATLKDPSFADAYDDYRLKQFPVISRWIITFILSIYAITVFFYIMRMGDDTMTLIMGLGLARPILMVMYTSMAMQKDHSQRKYLCLLKPRTLGNLVILWRAVIGGLNLIRRCYNGPCDSQDKFHALCNPSHEVDQLPAVPLLIFVLGSFIMPIVFQCHSSWASSFSMMVTFGSVLVSMYFTNMPWILYVSVLGLLATAVVGVVDYEYSTASSFTSYMGVEQAVREKLTAENEKLSVTENANELRHFIGNVAHDLKTPLQAFVSELDYLEGDEGVKSQGGRSSVLSLKSTCNFMTMTINRYFTHCSKTYVFAELTL